MDTFDEWVESGATPAVQQHSAKLLSLGVTRDTFMRDPKEVVTELVEAGIPKIPAGDIVRAATEYFKAQVLQAEKPMAVFWDMENFHIPAGMSGLAAAQCVKAKLEPFGSMHRQGFRVYASS